MSKKKAPALHERRGREDISTRPPRLAGYPIKLAGDARLHRLSLAADSCVNRKYYGGDPGVGQRETGLHTIPPSDRAAEGQAQGFRRFRTSRRPLNVAFVRAQDLTERKTRPAPPGRSVCRVCVRILVSVDRRRGPRHNTFGSRTNPLPETAGANGHRPRA